MKTLLRCWLVVFACLCGGMSGAMAGQDDGVFGGFFSYLPAPPHLELPRINLVPFWTDDLKRGRDSYVNGDYRSALDAFQKSSDDGNTIADWYLGTMYRLGRGVSINNAVAYSYYSRVAENFDPDEPDRNRLRVIIDAQLRMADYQRTGIKGANLKSNPQLAYRTYQRLATSYGHPGALYALGVMNIEGEGLKKNPQQGLKWLNAAVRKRSPDAAAYLAELYKRGDIVRQDDMRALMWYTIAAGCTRESDNPIIYSRLSELRFGATEETRLEAVARARLWNDQNPLPPE